MKIPLQTSRDGDKITKVCIEDVYRLSNRIIDHTNHFDEKVSDILDSIHKEYGGYEGEIIIGKGTSKPCGEDVFDEKIGNEIAFRKAKLNANLKKIRIIDRIIREALKFENYLYDEKYKLFSYIEGDCNELKKYD